jgi:ABC-2 type transport system permease protein
MSRPSGLVRKEQLRELTLAYAREITREWGVLFWGIAFPILMSLGLGIAFTKKADVVRKIAVIESRAPGGSADSTFSGDPRIAAFLRDRAKEIPAEGKTPERYEVTISSKKLGDTTFIFEKTTWDRATVLLKRGNIAVALGERDGRIEYHFDPRNPDAQLSYLKLSRLLGDGGPPGVAAAGDSGGASELSGANGAKGSADIVTEANDDNIVPLTVAGTRYIDFLIPGLMAMGIMMSSLWGVSYGLVEKRTKKLLRRMVATPMRKSHFLVALMTVRLGMNFVEAGLLFLFAFIVFGTTIQGSIPALFMIFIAGNVAFAGIAILASARTANTEVANGIINVVSLPMMVLSGVFFSYHNFPDWSIPYIQKLPLTLLADGIRSIFIEGAGYGEISVSVAILMAVGIVTFIAGLRAFRWY